MPEQTYNAAQELISQCSFKKSKNADEIFRALKNEHRTNQATFIRTIASVLEQYAEMNGDLRNEAAIQYAKNASKANEDQAIPYI